MNPPDPIGPPRYGAPPRRSWTRRHPVAAVLSLLAHGAVVVVLLLIVVPAPMPKEPPAVTVALLPGPLLAPAAPGEPAPAAKTTPVKVVKPEPGPKTPMHKAPRPPPPEVKTVAAGKAEPVAPVVEVSAAELAGASTADGSGDGGGGGNGSGAGGGACNMVRRLQDALRKDDLVLAAAHTPATAGKALKVWNGDWVQSSGEDGKGLAAVREAIMWEVAFAPAACRAQSVHGLVLLSLNDGYRSTRLALGTGDWRWSDLLGARGR